MGQSTDAILCFGIDLGEELPDFLNDPEDEDSSLDWGYFVASELGLAPDDHTARWDAEKKFPVTLVRHCSGDYPMYILALTKSVLNASRGYPETVPTGHDSIGAAGVMELKAFCEKHGVEWPDAGAKWLLCSWWC